MIFNFIIVSDDIPPASWGEIILVIILCAVCPFLTIPYWCIKAFARKHDIKAAIEHTYMIAMAFVLACSPIAVALSIASGGFTHTFEEYGIFFAIVIFEIHFSLWIAWNRKVKPKLSQKGVNKYTDTDKFCFNDHPLITGLYVVCLVAIVFKTFSNNTVNNFVPFLILIYGVWFFCAKLNK